MKNSYPAASPIAAGSIPEIGTADPQSPTPVAHDLNDDVHHPSYREFDLSEYCRRLHLSEEAERYLKAASLAPSRHPNGFRSNTVRLPCPEFGQTISAESLSLEFTFLLITKARPDVLRIFDQGPREKIQGTTSSETPYTFPFTPDYLVLTETGVEICELENTDESAAYYLKAKNRYQLVNGHYTSPPVAEHFARFNFKFMIFSVDDLDGRFAQNIRTLHRYQVGHPRTPITDAERDTLTSAARTRPGIRLGEIDLSPEARRCEVAYHLIAKGELFTHLSECRLDDPEAVRLFPTPQQERAFLLLRQTRRKGHADLKSLGYHLVRGSLIEIDGKEFTVSRIGVRDICLIDAKGSSRTLPRQALLDLKPRIGGIHNAEKTFEAVLANACQEDLVEFQRRWNLVAPYLPGAAKANETPVDRSIRRWRDRYNEAQCGQLVGLSGIFPGWYRCGNDESRFSATVEALITHVINKHHLRSEAETAMSTHLRIRALGRRLKLADDALPAYCTIVRRCAAVDPYKRTFRRQGKRAANGVRRIHPGKSPLGSPHGQMSMMIAHCDSTQVDLAHTHEDQSKEIRHLWHTKMIEANSGRVLAWVTFKERPSAKTLVALMIRCIEIHGALPSTIVVDWGSEHRNTWTERTLARMGVIVHYRPKATPGNGAPVESYFAKLSKELIHNLSGNTKLLQRARMVTKAVDPRNNTIWSEDLIGQLFESYYSTVNDMPRRNRPSPNKIAADCEAKFGPPPVQVLDRDLFRRMLLPYVDRVKRKVSPRGTIQCQHHTYAHHDLRFFAGREVDVRVDDSDPRRVFADHPTLRQVIECAVVDFPLKYADDADHAVDIVNEEARHREGSAKVIEARRVEFTEKVIQLEDVAKSQDAARRRKRRPRPDPADAAGDPVDAAPIVPLKLEAIISR